MLEDQKDFGSVLSTKPLKGIRLFKIAAFCIGRWIGTLKEIRNSKIALREGKVNDFINTLSLYKEVSSGWMKKVAKTSLRSLLINQNESLNFMESAFKS